MIWLPHRRAAFRGSPEITFLQANKDNTSGSSFTLSSVNFGAAASDRRIVAGIAVAENNSGTTVDSVTIGGVSATVIITAASGNATVAIAIAHVPSGSSGDVVVNLSATEDHIGVAMWRVTGLTGETATDSDSSSASPASVTLTTTTDGIAVGIACNTRADAGISWSGVTERVDDWIGTGEDKDSSRYGAADGVTDGTDLTIDTTWDNDTNDFVMAAASW